MNFITSLRNNSSMCSLTCLSQDILEFLSMSCNVISLCEYILSFGAVPFSVLSVVFFLFQINRSVILGSEYCSLPPTCCASLYRACDCDVTWLDPDSLTEYVEIKGEGRQTGRSIPWGGHQRQLEYHLQMWGGLWEPVFEILSTPDVQTPRLCLYGCVTGNSSLQGDFIW